MSPDIALLLFVAPLLLVMAASDIKYMRIPNWLALAMVAVFFVVAPFLLGFDDIVARAGIAAVVLLTGIVAFAFGFLAGGDVKALAALMLFVPTSATAIAYFGFTFSAAMLIGIIFILVLRRGFASRGTTYVSLTIEQGYPMGLSIAMAGIALPAVLLVFG